MVVKKNVLVEKEECLFGVEKTKTKNTAHTQCTVEQAVLRKY